MRSGAANRAVVVGAGTAGLANAAALRAAGYEVQVIEVGAQAGASWAGRYRSLRLNTLRSLSGLPGFAIDRRCGDWVSGSDFAEYLVAYAKHFSLDLRTNTRVQAILPDGDGAWRVTTTRGSFPAEIVVVATGNAGDPRIPDWSAGFGGRSLHTANYRSPADVSGGSVLVVGSGNSATEIATELSQTVERVWLSVRTPPLLVKSRQLGLATHRISVVAAGLPDWVWDASSLASHRSLYRDLPKLGLNAPTVGSHSKFRATLAAPVAERGFADAVRAGRITVVPDIARAAGAEIELGDGRTLRPDTLVLASGYRSSFPALLSGLGVLDERGRPIAWAAPLQEARGLFVVGSPSLQGDIREHGREARRVVQAALAARVAGGGVETRAAA